LPERRRDRDDVKWTLRSAQSKRSIFQVQEGEDKRIKAATASEEQLLNAAQMETAPKLLPKQVQTPAQKAHGVMESYFASNAYGSSYVGLNFAVATPISDHVELIFAGQLAAVKRLNVSKLQHVSASTIAIASA
jgi:hypothetical protein